jgi:predicted Zn finger-like uncharacterized protein
VKVRHRDRHERDSLLFRVLRQHLADQFLCDFGGLLARILAKSFMPSPNASLFRCPNCNALYQVVRAKAGPKAVDLETACGICGGVFVVREGLFVLKYFLLQLPNNPGRLLDHKAATHRVGERAPRGATVRIDVRKGAAMVMTTWPRLSRCRGSVWLFS